MKLTPPAGWTAYVGADGVDVIPDAGGYLWWADNIYIEGRKSDTFVAAIFRTKNNVTERIPTPEICNGAIRLNWSPAGLQASSSINGQIRTWTVPQFIQFTAGVPVIVQLATPAAVSVDTLARTVASQALQEASRATERANTAQNTADGKPSLEAVWQKINDRLYGLFVAFSKNTRTDQLDAYAQDILFKKVNDWIYLWMNSKS